ncbi:ABC transporter ATP-binding protein [Anaeromusa sp.]|uniref:ABC transporter ATP-binding protein n=1 Tax=Anaeromusa sp. TaxID=1872520 RepID=UPI0026054211|nr:ABC transporter ATP-binding protein [Anaeromusa sp.]MDD3158333.1 ABC transporter ATP-binding protein [Anaeromusa sp.]
MKGNQFAIVAQQLSKAYRLYDAPVDRLKEVVHPLRKSYHRDFFALQDVSFQIPRGETVAIVGKNGSGKSTLLKIISGVLTPTSGAIQVQGKTAALLELGAGFNPEISGWENIYLNGMVLGYSREDIDQRVESIAAFADIGEFIYQPVKSYSSGMFARLAFAVNTHVNPDILIVDEALAVGDMFFQAKCMKQMKKMVDQGVTLLFVSHDTAAVKSLCSQALLLEQGRLAAYDSAAVVVEQYFASKVRSEQMVVAAAESSAVELESAAALVQNEPVQGCEEFAARAAFQRLQNGSARFLNVQLLDRQGRTAAAVEYGQELLLQMLVEVSEDCYNLGCAYHIRDRLGNDIIYSDSLIEDKVLYNVKAGERYLIKWRFKSELMQGVHNIACTLSTAPQVQTQLTEQDLQTINLETVVFCDSVPCAVQFQMMPRQGGALYGAVHWPNSLEIAPFPAK